MLQGLSLGQIRIPTFWVDKTKLTVFRLDAHVTCLNLPGDFDCFLSHWDWSLCSCNHLCSAAPSLITSKHSVQVSFYLSLCVRKPNYESWVFQWVGESVSETMLVTLSSLPLLGVKPENLLSFSWSWLFMFVSRCSGLKNVWRRS